MMGLIYIFLINLGRERTESEGECVGTPRVQYSSSISVISPKAIPVTWTLAGVA